MKKYSIVTTYVDFVVAKNMKEANKKSQTNIKKGKTKPTTQTLIL